VLASGADQHTVMALASQLSTGFLPLIDSALLSVHRRQQELVWTEGLVERIEDELEQAGTLGRPVVVQGGDCFGRTVSLAARIADLAGPGQVLVNAAARGPPSLSRAAARQAP
jgi:class 3 adenylate cyclase